jgi:hypothetical protein
MEHPKLKTIFSIKQLWSYWVYVLPHLSQSILHRSVLNQSINCIYKMINFINSNVMEEIPQCLQA